MLENFFNYLKLLFVNIYIFVSQCSSLLISWTSIFEDFIYPLWIREERIPLLKISLIFWLLLITLLIANRGIYLTKGKWIDSYKKGRLLMWPLNVLLLFVILWSGVNSIIMTLSINIFALIFGFIGGASGKWYRTIRGGYTWYSALIFMSSVCCLIDLWLTKSHYIFITLKWDFIFLGNYSLLLDFVNIHFILLTTFLIPMCMIISLRRLKAREYKPFITLLLLTEFILLNVFLTNDILFFYIWFEAVAIPVFGIIGIYGSRSRKIHASYMFWFYTLGGSLLMLIAIVTIYSDFGTTFIHYIVSKNISYQPTKESFLFWCFFVSIMIKTPMLPFHIWLPEAHVEAPTAGSVLLAGVLLKLGTYGAIRFVIPLFYESVMYYRPLIMTIALISIIYSSLSTIRQIDLKKIIAYSSVAHMNVVILGLFSGFESGYQGSVFLMVAHGIVSSALFICIGALYDRFKTKNIMYYSGLVIHMPLFSSIFFLLTLANSGFPIFCNFIGELTCLISCFKYSTFAALVGSTGMIFGAIYSFWLFNRICFRHYNSTAFMSTTRIKDLNPIEFSVLIPFVILSLFFGVFPNYILENISNYSILV